MAAPWSVVGASVIGSSHIARGTTCQDAHCIRVSREGAVAIAVADGAGSAGRSDEGAWVAVHRAAATLDRLASGGAALESRAGLEGGSTAGPAEEADGSLEPEAFETIMGTALGEARAAVENLAAQEDAPLRSFHCTLSCALLVGEVLTIGQVGDGACVARRQDGSLFTAGLPQRGEYANEAYFVTMEGALDRADVRVVPDLVDAVAVLSDGLLRLALDLRTNEPHRPFHEPLFGYLATLDDERTAGPALARFLASPRVVSRSDDDKTLVLAVRRRGEPGADE